MSSQFISLEEAAKLLGVSSEELVSMRSDGKIRGFRDGTSWKFSVDDVKRTADELKDENEAYDPYKLVGDDGGDDDEYRLAAEDDDSAESSESPAAAAGPATFGSDDIELKLDEPVLTHDSEELDLTIEPSSASSGSLPLEEVSGNQGGDSELRLQADDQDSDDEVLGLSEDVLGTEPVASGGTAGSGLELMEDADDLVGGASGVLSDIDVLGNRGSGSSLISRGSGSSGVNAGDDDDDLLITDNEDELVLGGGSDLSISGDSGINLMSPSDSGISLESEPLDLAGSSISSIDLSGELGSDIGSGGSGSGSVPGAEDFQLSPSGLALDADNDSSSQVIEVEDSAAFAEVDPDGLDAAAFGEALDGDDAFGEEPGEGGFDEEASGLDEGFGEEAAPVRAGGAATYELPYSVFEVVGLVCVVTVMSLGGMLMSDLVRNLWTYSEPAAPVSGLTDWLIDISPFGS